ncbi:hypothetical protein AVEN_66527-1 [Araneus ventricosus]|uniref:Receptor ligand binding region domain-containing protein n=1 Tax=Araneus ventricosus TaxID=182803 RepID=A0A4Y2EDD7_ARAVE|nr:hypothetical protein AVEN_66527-1 [Araneus ventricosus]
MFLLPFQKCSDSKVSEKTIFSTFARTLPPSSKVSKSLIALLKDFEWNQLVLLVSDNPSEKQIAEALIHLAQRNDIAILETFYLPGDYLTKDNTTLKEIVMQTYERTRGNPSWLHLYVGIQGVPNGRLQTLG